MNMEMKKEKFNRLLARLLGGQFDLSFVAETLSDDEATHQKCQQSLTQPMTCQATTKPLTTSQITSGHATAELERERQTAREDLLRFFRENQDHEKIWPRFSTDTRSIAANDYFVAFSGLHFDAHDYLLTASQKGAKLAIVAQEQYQKKSQQWRQEGLHLPLLVVADTYVAYRELASFYRHCFLPCLVAITGSVGKTSTREMVTSALEACTTVHRTPANLNNEIGVPQTVLSAPLGTEIAVIEMGMDRPGDIRLLTQMTEPDIAIITGIGFSHLEFFGTQEAILRAKAEIVEGLKKDGHLLLHARDPYLVQLARELEMNEPWRRQAFVFACKSGEWFDLDLPGPCFVAHDVQSDDRGHYRYALYLYEGRNRCCLSPEISLPVAGEHQVINSLFALLTAHLLNKDLEQAIQGLRHFAVVGNRQRMHEVAGMTLINDSYNAAPESMLAALRTLALLAQKQDRPSLALLACIAELGAKAPQIHYELGKEAGCLKIDKYYLCGEFAKDLAQGIRASHPQAQVQTFTTRDELAAFVLPTLRERDIILVKGSRSYQMEVICDRILAEKMEK